MSEKRKLVWLDCDPGHDDAMAIILAGHNKSLKLLGISTVAGNQTVEKTSMNALKTLHIAGLDHIDVSMGQSKPLLGVGKICPEIHGDSGLDGPIFPEIKTRLVSGKAINHMYSVISSQDEKVHLIATGCLTNIALLLTVYPEIKDKIEQFTMMGGAIGQGNTHPASEFNIECDADAARIVFDSGMKIVMVPLEVTHTVLVNQAIIKRLEKLDSKFGKFIIELLLFFMESYSSNFGFPDPPLHDPCAIAYVISPELFETKFCHVEVDCGPTSYGRTNVDLFGLSKHKKNVHVALKIQVEQFWNLMFEAFQSANEISPLNQK